MKIETKLKYRGRDYRKFKDLYTERMKLVKLQYIKEVMPIMKEIIVDEYIAQGESPVAYQRDYVDYSPSYKKQIRQRWSRLYGKKLKPINLKLTGALHGSFFVRRRANTGIEIGFSDIKASYHNDGGAVPKRQLLPKGKQKFKTPILNRLKKVLVDVTKKVF